MSEIKVCNISFHNTPQGMCPYFTLVDCLQTINESNYFYTTSLKAFNIPATKSGNAVLLNFSTDGVACEYQGNIIPIVQYLNGKIDYVALVDTNHNINNLRYQLIGGLLPTYFEIYVFDPWLLNLANISKILQRIEDYASNVIVL